MPQENPSNTYKQVESIVRLIEEAMWVHDPPVTLMPLMCGMGKSTAISYVIRDVLERGQGEGLLVVTDSVERLNGYLMPHHPELAEYIRQHREQITLMDSDNKSEAMVEMHKRPVLLMTTQRYFSLSVREIQDALKWQGGTRQSIIIDEKPYIKSVETVSRSDVNTVASAIADGIPLYENGDGKHSMMDYWEMLRQQFYHVVQDYESHSPGANNFYAACSGGIIHEDSDYRRFMNSIYSNHGHLRRADPDSLDKIHQVLSLLMNGGLFHSSSGQHYKSCFYTTMDRWYCIHDIDAKVIILDGTGDIHPDYDHREDLYWETKLPSRSLNNLTIHFVHADTSKTRLTSSDRQNRGKKAIISYLDSLGIDKTKTPLFTYKSCEGWFKKQGFARTGHFGDLKGRNQYADADVIVQVGMNLYAQQDYLTLWLHDDPDELMKLKQLDVAALNERMDELNSRPEVKAMQNRILLSDMEQNLFRGAIRRMDYTEQATFYILCDTKMHRALIDMAKARYERYGATVTVDPKLPDVMAQSKRTNRKAKDPARGTAHQRFMTWYKMCPAGRELTKQQLLQEAGLSSMDLKNLSRKGKNGLYIDTEAGLLLKGMHMGRGRYKKPLSAE